MIADSEDTGKFANSLNEHLEKFLNGLDRPRILLAGAAGSGKSTLANLVLNREVCRTGSGKPVTRGIIEYSVPDFNSALPERINRLPMITGSFLIGTAPWKT